VHIFNPAANISDFKVEGVYDFQKYLAKVFVMDVIACLSREMAPKKHDFTLLFLKMRLG
jgi:hypothetical protein